MEENVMLANAFADMYAKCDDLEKPQWWLMNFLFKIFSPGIN